MTKNDKPLLMVPSGNHLEPEDNDEIQVGDTVCFKDFSLWGYRTWGKIIAIDKGLIFRRFLIREFAGCINPIHKKYRWQLFKINQ